MKSNAKGLIGNALHLGQMQRWSLMSVLYLSVSSFCLSKCSWWQGVLTLKYARCATLEYPSMCMFARLRSRRCANNAFVDDQGADVAYVSSHTFWSFLLTIVMKNFSRLSHCQIKYVICINVTIQ